MWSVLTREGTHAVEPAEFADADAPKRPGSNGRVCPPIKGYESTFQVPFLAAAGECIRGEGVGRTGEESEFPECKGGDSGRGRGGEEVGGRV
jgi:hypothetical protein